MCLFAFICLFLHFDIPSGLSSDGVGMGQRWTDRADGGPIHGPPEDHSARLVPEYGRWRDVAKQHFTEKGSEVSGSDTHPLGWVSAGAPKV